MYTLITYIHNLCDIVVTLIKLSVLKERKKRKRNRKRIIGINLYNLLGRSQLLCTKTINKNQRTSFKRMQTNEIANQEKSYAGSI